MSERRAATSATMASIGVGGIRPRYVVLDTSHIAGLVSDLVSGDRERHRTAQSFVPRLVELGWLPLLSWSQLEELIQHENDDLVEARLRYLWSWTLMAWIRPFDPAGGPGGVVDLLAAEAMAAYARPSDEVLEVRDAARDSLISVGSGTDAIPESFRDWRLLREELARRQENARRVAAISPWKGSETHNKRRMGDLMKSESRKPAEALRMFEHLSGSLANEIETRGDKRIADPKAMANAFFYDIFKTGLAAAAGASVPTPIQLLQAEGVDIDDIKPDDTFEQVMDRHVFRKRLRIAAESRGLPYEQLKKVVTQERLPVAVIHSAMRAFGHDQPERKGSDLNDVHLLSLAPYADLTFVDKRTLESVRRARQKVPVLDGLLGDVRKASGHREISSVIAVL